MTTGRRRVGVLEKNVDLALAQRQRQRAMQLAKNFGTVLEWRIGFEKQVDIAPLRLSSAREPNTLTRAPAPSTRWAVWRIVRTWSVVKRIRTFSRDCGGLVDQARVSASFSPNTATAAMLSTGMAPAAPARWQAALARRCPPCRQFVVISPNTGATPSSWPGVLALRSMENRILKYSLLKKACFCCAISPKQGVPRR